MEHIESTLEEDIQTEDSELLRFILQVGSKDEDEKLLAAKRRKFYKAIGKGNHIEVNDSEADSNAGDEHFDYFSFLNIMLNGQLTFDDSIVIEKFKKIKCPKFNLNEYINAVKWLYHNWLGTDTDVLDLGFHNTLLYLLAHSRDFNEPSRNLYSFFEEGTDEIVLNVDYETVEDNLPGDTEYVRNLNKLITDLLCEYNENKYRQLNLNVTYLTLLLSRRIVKSEQEFTRALLSKKTHEDFATLCPNPLDSDLPKLSDHNKLNFKFGQTLPLINLILYGYLNSKGRRRKIFRKTCINYMEYNGIGLAKLFYDVAKLYNIDDYKLWDIMSYYNECFHALFSLADLVHTHSEMISSDPPKTYKLFPFCRLLDHHYHLDLANKHRHNLVTCYALAVLVDLKLSQTKSFAKNAHWTNSLSPTYKAQGENIAKEIYSKINTELI